MDVHSLAHKISLSTCPLSKLGLKPDCNAEDIERAFKLRARVLHPDKCRNGCSEAAKDEFIALKLARDDALIQCKQKQLRPHAGAGQRSWWEGYADADDFDLPVAAAPGSYWVAPGLAQVKSVGQPPPRPAPPRARTNLASAGATKPQPPPKAPARHQQQQDQEAHGSQHTDTLRSNSGTSSASLEEQPGEAAPAASAAAAAPPSRAQQAGPLHAAAYHKKAIHPHSQPAVNSLRQQIDPAAPPPPKHAPTGTRPGPIDQSSREHTQQHTRHSLDSRSALQLLQELHRPPASSAPSAAAAATTATAAPPSAPLAGFNAALQQQAGSPAPRALSASPLACGQQRSRRHRLRPMARQANNTRQQQQQQQQLQQGQEENGIDLQEDLEDDEDGVQQQQQQRHQQGQQEVGQTASVEQQSSQGKGQQSECHRRTPEQHLCPAQRQPLGSKSQAPAPQPSPKVAAGGVLLPPSPAQHCTAPQEQKQQQQERQQQQGPQQEQQQQQQQQQLQQQQRELESLAAGQGKQAGARSNDKPPSQQRHGHTLDALRSGRLRASGRAGATVAGTLSHGCRDTPAVGTHQKVMVNGSAAAEATPKGAAHTALGSELELPNALQRRENQDQLLQEQHQHKHQQECLQHDLLQGACQQHQHPHQQQQLQHQAKSQQNDNLQKPCQQRQGEKLLQELAQNAQPPSARDKVKQHQPHSSFVPKGRQHQTSIDQMLGLLLPQPEHQRQPSSHLCSGALSSAAAAAPPPPAPLQTTTTTTATISARVHPAAPDVHPAVPGAPQPLTPSEAAPSSSPAPPPDHACRPHLAPHAPDAAVGTLSQCTRARRGQLPIAGLPQLLLSDACKQQEGPLDTSGGALAGGLLASGEEDGQQQKESFPTARGDTCGQQQGRVHQGGATKVGASEGASLEDSMEEGMVGQRARKRMRRLLFEDQEDEMHEKDGDGEGLDEAEPVTIDDDEDDDAIEEVEPAGRGMPSSRPSAAEHAHGALQVPGVATASSWREQAQQSATAHAHKLARDRATNRRRQFAGRRSRGGGGASSAIALLQPISRGGSSRSSSSGHSGGRSGGHGARGRGRGPSSSSMAGGKGGSSRGRASTQKSLAHFVCKRTALR